jgi:hypothetical protein
MRMLHIHRPLGVVLAGVVCVGVRCGGPAEEPDLSPGHFGGWDAFVNASWRGDQEKAGLIAVDMTGGAEADASEGPAADAVTTVNGALGLAAVAQGREELIQAVTVAARGCGQCHEARAVEPKPRSCDHASAALCLVDVVVWPGSAGPAIVPGGPNEDLKREWLEPVAAESPHTDTEARAARALLSCTRCHEKPP